jgi:hypothetical protein
LPTPGKPRTRGGARDPIANAAKTVRSQALSALLWCAVAGMSDIAAATTPLTGEFQVNTVTAGHQYRSRMSMSSDGSFVVTWTSASQDGNGFGIVAKRFDSAGGRVGGEFVVNSYTLDDQQYPAVSVNEAGLFVVVWRGHDGQQGGIFVRRYDTAGAPLGLEFQVNTYTASAQTAPDVAVGPQGGFFVVWESAGQDGDLSGIFARRHNGSGIPQATEFQVNEQTLGHQARPRIAIAQPGNLVVVWSSGGTILGRRVGQAGTVGGEFQINAQTGAGATLPALAPTGDGGIVVAWQSALDGDLAGVVARRFDSVGAPLTNELQVNTYTVGEQSEVEVAGNGTDFVVVWQSSGEDGDDEGIFARRLDLDGPVGDAFRVNVHTINAQRAPAVGSSAQGEFVVVWDSSRDGYGYGVFARRFTVLDPATLDVDGDGATEALTDGLLVLRFLFGFTGAPLTNGALAPGCTRCDGAAIASYLTALDLVLDADEDGELEALTDGLLVLRFLFGFTGAALVAGAVDDDCTRCDAASIETYLQTLD